MHEFKAKAKAKSELPKTKVDASMRLFVWKLGRLEIGTISASGATDQ
jgi:hypothetical protein